MTFTLSKMKSAILFATLLLYATSLQVFASNDNKQTTILKDVKQINPTSVELRMSNGQTITLDFYGENIFRMFQDVNGGIIRDPKPMTGYPEVQRLL